MNGALGFSFVAGAVATVNPCGFALLPAYLARQLVRESRPGTAAAAVRALAVATLATLGFLFVFVSVGSAVALAGDALTGTFPWVGLVVGVVLSLVGLAVLSGHAPTVRLPRLGTQPRTRRLPADFLFGIGYGLASLSCALPLFLATLGTALTGSVSASLTGFVAYALGMGAVLASAALTAALSRQGLARVLRRLGRHVERASGALLLAAGVYVTDYWAVDIWRPRSGSLAARSTDVGGMLATTVSTWLASRRVHDLLLGVTAALLVFGLWALRGRARARLSVRPLRAPEHVPRMRGHLFALAAFAALTAAAAASAFAVMTHDNGERPIDRSALLGFIDPVAMAPPFALRDQFGSLTSPNRLRGRPIVIAFVYSHCRDACPLTAAKIRAAQLQLGSSASGIAWLAISVDPSSDTRTSVRAFSRRYGLLRSWHYLFRPHRAVMATLKAYGVQPQLTAASGPAYLQHSTYVSLFDRQGRRVESFTAASLTSTALVHDLRLVLGERPGPVNVNGRSHIGPSAQSVAKVFTASAPRVATRQGVLAVSGTDLATGRTVSLDAETGKPIVLNAWGSWCGGCAAEAPALAAFARAHPEIAVIGLDLEDTRTAALAFVHRFALPFPSIFDPNAVTAPPLGVSGLPTTIFLDRRHRVAARVVGESSRKRFEAGLRQAEQR